MKHSLRDDWRNAWRFISMRAIAFAAGIQGTWAALPDDMKASIPHNIVSWVTLACLFLGAYGVMVKQESLNPTYPPKT